jgi:hypothetical protein
MRAGAKDASRHQPEEEPREAAAGALIISLCMPNLSRDLHRRCTLAMFVQQQVRVTIAARHAPLQSGVFSGPSRPKNKKKAKSPAPPRAPKAPRAAAKQAAYGMDWDLLSIHRFCVHVVSGRWWRIACPMCFPY